MTTAVTSSLGEQVGPFEGKLDVLRNADMVMTIGANLLNSHMVAGFLVKRALPKGMRLVNIDPEESEMDEIADLAIKPQAGSDLALILGLQAVIAAEGLGRAPLAIPNAEEMIASAASAAGVSVETLQQAARMLANAVAPVILFGKGITAQSDEKVVAALLDLARLCGAVDSERFGLISMKGEANSSAAAQLGLEKKFELNGHQAVFALIGDSFISKYMVERIASAPFKVVQAAYKSKLTEAADIVLPTTIWSEQEGHYVNLDGRVQKAEKVLNAPEGIRENTAILAELAMRMNMPLKQDWHAALKERQTSLAIA